MKRKAEMRRTTNEQYYFQLIGDNGETIATSETYTKLEKVRQTLKKYFPDFPRHNLTGGPKPTKSASKQ